MRIKHLLLLVVLLAFGAACDSQAEEIAPAETVPAETVPAETTPATARSAPPTTAAEVAATEVATTGVSTTAAEGEDPEFPATVNGVVIPEKPTAIVSMSPTATEVLFAIGAGGQVIAVDAASDYPPEAPVTDLSGFQPNLEAVASYRPDLVVISWDPGEVEAGLGALGIPVLIQTPAQSIEDAYLQMLQLGAAAGRRTEAEELVSSIREEIDGLVGEYGTPGSGLTYYHEVDDTLFSAASNTFIGSVYALFGLENIADSADALGSGYPQLSAEYILETDPHLVFFGCALWCGTTAENIAERPGWSTLRAVAGGALVEVDDDLSSRWGPRLIEFVRLVGEALAARPPAGEQ